MATHQGTMQVMAPETQMIGWETPSPYRDKIPLHRRKGAAMKQRWINTSKIVSRKLDRVIPPHRKYCGCSRRVLLIFCIVVFVVIVALAIGLGVGLTRGSDQNLPLPSNSESFKGDLTYYSPGLGACGITSSDSDDICAVSHIIFDAVSKGSDPNSNPLCGLKIRATRFDESVNAQRSVDLKVVDRCTGCAQTDIDLSPGAFKKLADPVLGRADVTWAWLSPAPSV
ncbi:hypothetical protein MMC22_008663 [Lobaria immixta]|nr:hypothetical protein [Lobaria immixta]